MSDYLSIKELADKVGITTQAIYQRLGKDLKPYLQVKDGKKLLNRKVLNLFEVSVNKEVDKDITNDLQTSYQDTIKALTDQLNIKDNQIETLQSELIEQNSHSRQQANKLITLVEQVNDLQRNNQILLKTEQDKTIQSISHEEVMTEENSERKKKGFFKKFTK